VLKVIATHRGMCAITLIQSESTRFRNWSRTSGHCRPTKRGGEREKERERDRARKREIEREKRKRERVRGRIRGRVRERGVYDGTVINHMFTIG
jgi:hypothetical protein